MSQYLQDIISTIPGGIYWKNKEGVYLGCNEYVVRVAGFQSVQDIVGKTDHELWPDQSEALRKNDYEVMDFAKTITIEEKVLLKGKEHFFTVIKMPLRDPNGNIVGVIGNSLEITALKQTQHNLEIAKADAESANILKTNFIQNMQHDIRAPASIVWKILEMLVEKRQTPTEEILVVLRDSAKQLWGICNDVIDFDKIENGEVPVLSKKLDIREVVSNVIDLNQAIAFNKGLKLTFSVDDNVPHILKGDEHRLSRVFVNLIGNAIKFTQQGSITLKATRLKEQKKDCIIHFMIKDTGIGMPPESKTSLYEKFNRFTPANRNTYKGSGLGLRIVKKYVDDMDGEIDVESELGKGTTFYINIPFEEALVEQFYSSSNPATSSPKEVRKKKENKPKESLLKKFTTK